MLRLSCLLLTLFYLAASAFAQEDLLAQRFKLLDTNRDGKLSMEELKAQPLIYNRLKGADANQDGFLTLEEIRNFMQPMKPGSADVSKPAPVRE
ncbi:MAG TPA: hypothetical protein PKA06_14675, partial [Gemmatales bacterium]|nr:hypothetical protein [Gemmatales bacterium]